jgi:hypothetical protein
MGWTVQQNFAILGTVGLTSAGASALLLFLIKTRPD